MPSRPWVTLNEAVAILTANTDHEVHPRYVKVLADTNKIRMKRIDGRTIHYNRHDLEKYHVRPKGTPRVRPLETRPAYLAEQEAKHAQPNKPAVRKAKHTGENMESVA